ncbi:hypothetical protein F0P96_13780 [Hymenobacter busanensis]|uniref:UPF0323 domain-containing protein n=1 Tax=Hymenobacter busanensis TaxID=2607656 RepID=A0A7L4ZYZ8_9BACT|nr:hypothetical protein [Hymenobacter busanensis]KAA9331317.1 hypothetical protein F0P96_13780 [Hymenobacter busanensis]QHJ08468.1 hypothetical protein GUY19_14705 [Hymenobacter busanensis]
MKKNFYPLGSWRRNLLLVAAAASLGLAVLPACSSDNRTDTEEAGDWSGETYSQGVITEMTEVQPNDWKITAERPAGKEEVAAILHHFDGKTDTLQGQALQRQMQDYSRQHPENRVGHSGMMDVLMWSGIGYMAGRFLTPNPSYYANPGLLAGNQGWRQNIAHERETQGRGFFGRGFVGSRSSRTAGVQESRTFSRGAYRSSAPRMGRSSGFGSRGGFGGRGFGG